MQSEKWKEGKLESGERQDSTEREHAGMDVKEAMAYMEEAGKCGGTPEEGRMAALCDKLGNPQAGLPIVHITGENGKSSVAAFLQSIIKCSGYRAGCYTSPAMGGFREKICVNGRPITRQGFADCLESVREAAEELAAEGKGYPVPAEIEAAAAFLYFRRQGCGILLLEKGAGGSPDAAWMAAKEKMTVCVPEGEIMVDGVPVRKPGTAKKIKYGIEKQRFTYGTYDPMEISMGGKFQVENAVLAVKTAEALETLGFPMNEKQIAGGLRKAGRKGCFTVLSQKPYIIADSAHNGAAAKKLAESLRFYFPKKPIVYILGAIRTEDYEKIIQEAAPLAAHIITITIPDQPGTLHAYELAQTAASYHPAVTAADSLEEALELAFLLAGKDGIITAFGSPLYLGALEKTTKKRIDMPISI